MTSWGTSLRDMVSDSVDESIEINFASGRREEAERHWEESTRKNKRILIEIGLI